MPRFPRSGVPEIDALVRSLREMHVQLTERFEQLRREQGASGSLLEAMIEGVIAADGRGRVITGQPGRAADPGLRSVGPAARPARALPHPARRGRWSRPARGGAAVDGPGTGDGRQVLSASARPLPGGGVILVLIDLTEVRRLEHVRRDFVANVSHELKTPLTSISGYAETLLADRPDGRDGRAVPRR